MAALFFSQFLAICFLVARIGSTMAAMPTAPAMLTATPMPGSSTHVPSDRCDVRQAAWFAVAVYNKQASQEDYAYRLTSIVSAETQVVAGLNYILTAELGMTWCQRAQATDAETCPLQVNRKRLLCRFTVYTIPWERKAVLTKNRCIEKPFPIRCYRRSLAQGTR
ncbi:cystatin-C-like [Brienomyrus brachyistius]|uniref:cystatin-C-like n=2 Tax=Brienomyrus brachyistius TaxID=42636 RepID=UPI0020B1E0F6|nr:cystatin-C-like [Brienomyrus brachyistius]XP_048865634.1 cystatin-C-like [Brienomyrus brachyistius]XP_048865636.1 cystatin-C-like [Brienomyrus brachyistius]